MAEENEALRGKLCVRSAAVFNRSKKLHTMAYNCMLSEGFTKQELDNHKPSYKKDCLKLFKNADIIIGMTKSHKFLTPREFRHKFKTLSEVAIGSYIAIPDPFLKTSQEEYNKVMKVILDYLIKYKDNLIKELSCGERND